MEARFPKRIADASQAGSHEWIEVVGARENNLQDVSLSIRKRALTVFTGVSGSGKSSLVFDVIAAESQRQLNETFSTFARHRMPHYGQPQVERIENLSVAIVIDQKRLGGNARSTVGTATDIYSLILCSLPRRTQWSIWGLDPDTRVVVWCFKGRSRSCRRRARRLGGASRSRRR